MWGLTTLFCYVTNVTRCGRRMPHRYKRGSYPEALDNVIDLAYVFIIVYQERYATTLNNVLTIRNYC